MIIRRKSRGKKRVFFQRTITSRSDPYSLQKPPWRDEWNEYGSDPGVIFRWKNNLFFPLDLLLLITQDSYDMSSTHIFILPILKTNSKNLLPQHILDTSQSLLTQPYMYPHPCLLLHSPNLGCHYLTHPDLNPAPPLLFFLLHIFSNRLVNGSWGGCRRGYY